jgi:hypothetical protein
MADEFKDKLSIKYKNIVKNIENIFGFELEVFNDINYDFINKRSLLFYEIMENENLFVLFINNKIKVFSSKNDDSHQLSKSLFGEIILLKNLFNNQPEEDKNNLWSLLLGFYLFLEENNKNRNDRIKLLHERMSVLKQKISNDIKENILKVDVNKTTNNMIDDIVGCFQDMTGENENPFKNIMQVTSQISEKYYNNIKSGDIEIDKILSNISLGDLTSQLGKEDKVVQDEPVIIDENFTTANVELGDEDEKENNKGIFGDVMNMANTMPDIANLTSMISDIQNAQTEEEVMNIKNKMDSFIEKEMGVDMNEFNESMSKLQEKMEGRDNIEE